MDEQKIKNDLIYIEYLIENAKGKRLYDLLQYRKRLKRELYKGRKDENHH